MSWLWTIPPVATAVGALVALARLREVAEAATDLQIELHRAGELHLAMAEVRSASAEARVLARGLRRA